jgi:hypothetical protein
MQNHPCLHQPFDRLRIIANALAAGDPGERLYQMQVVEKSNGQRIEAEATRRQGIDPGKVALAEPIEKQAEEYECEMRQTLHSHGGCECWFRCGC